MIEYIKLKQENMSLSELVSYVIDVSGLKKELEEEKTLESEVRLENLEEFKSIAYSFEKEKGVISLSDFLMELSLVSDVEEYKNLDNAVTLMTVHSAKGLEFDCIYLIGMEEGIFPHNNSLCSSKEIEEERRLCYVALTRAKKKLYLVNSKRRLYFGCENYNPVSRFINEIDDKYLEKDNNEETIKIKNVDMVDNSIEYKVGDKIIHDTFKQGIIIGVDKSILTIAFPHPIGIKKLLKGHKSIKKV